jgi:hypothetical protein
LTVILAKQLGGIGMGSYELNQNDPTTILKELNTGKVKHDAGRDALDAVVVRDSDKSDDVFTKLEILPPSVRSHRFDYRGAKVHVSSDYRENFRKADFHFLTDIPGGNSEQYFYIHARNGRRIIRYLNGRVELD